MFAYTTTSRESLTVLAVQSAAAWMPCCSTVQHTAVKRGVRQSHAVQQVVSAKLACNRILNCTECPVIEAQSVAWMLCCMCSKAIISVTQAAAHTARLLPSQLKLPSLQHQWLALLRMPLRLFSCYCCCCCRCGFNTAAGQALLRQALPRHTSKRTSAHSFAIAAAMRGGR